MRRTRKLTPLAIRSAKEPGLYHDGDGLGLQVSAGGTKSWVFRFMLHGRARKMGLGSISALSLSEARDRATAARRLLLDGVDPIAHRNAGRTAAAAAAMKRATFKECADAFVTSRRETWKNEKHRTQWERTLAVACKTLGALTIDAIDTALVLKVLEPIWTTTPETASRLRGRIEAVLNWATVRGLRAGDNPARWRGHLDNVLPQKGAIRAVRHHAALPYSETPAFMQRLRALTSVSARALEFSILTAARTGETIGATIGEVDEAAALWVVPAGRMKAKREHRVPLCRRALEIITEIKRDDDWLFPGLLVGNGLSNMAMLETLRGLSLGITVHGFRSTFRDWAGDCTEFDRQTIEFALAHGINEKTEAAYRRTTALEKRRLLMADWAAYCAGARSPASITPIRAAAGH